MSVYSIQKNVVRLEAFGSERHKTRATGWYGEVWKKQSRERQDTDERQQNGGGTAAPLPVGPPGPLLCLTGTPGHEGPCRWLWARWA